MNSHITQLILCSVCKVETNKQKRCGAFVCEPCKRFFLRHRNNSSALKCDSVSSKCLTMEREAFETGKSWNGSTIRFACQHCRFAKCLEVGMGRNDRIEKYKVFLMEPSATFNQPSNDELKVYEDTFQHLINAFKDFKISCGHLPARNSQLASRVVDKMSAWAVGMMGHGVMATTFGEYTAKLSCFEEISPSERTRLSADSFLKITLVESTLQECKPLYLGMSEDLWLKTTQFFPELSYIKSEADDLMAKLRAWNPNFAETAFLMALLFFDDKLPRRLRDNLEKTLAFFIAKEYGNSAAIRRREMLTTIISSLEPITDRRLQTFSLIFERHPDVVHYNGN